MTFQRVLITGAGGLLGQELVKQLSLNSRLDVLATGRDELPSFTDASVGYTSMDISDFGRVREVFEDFAPHVVVNCAAMAGVDLCETEREQCWTVNVEAVENMARLCRTHGSRLVQISTDFVFDGLGGPYQEDARPNPVNFYGKSKFAAENAVRQMNPDKWVIVRTVLVFGTGRSLKRTNVGMWIVADLTEGKPIRVFTDQLRSPTYVADLANGLERIIRLNRTGVFHVSGREYMSLFEFAQSVAKAFDLDSSLISPVTREDFQLVAERPPKTGFIILKAETELGYRPHALADSLRDLRSRIDSHIPHTS
ncbi:dTDP-4-dehydrorhamnose reductase [Bacteroidota bacterium]